MLADDGRLVIIALLGGAKANVDLSAVLRRRLVITGSTLRPRPVEFKGRSPASCARLCGRWSRPAGSGRCCTGPIRWQRRRRARADGIEPALGKIVLEVGAQAREKPSARAIVAAG